LIRRTVVAGRFYPSSRDGLEKELDRCFKVARKNLNADNLKKEVFFGGISPHAGYMFSGEVSAGLFSCLDVEKLKKPVFVLLGPDHTGLSLPLAISGADCWETPLGMVSVDKELRDITKVLDVFEVDNASHSQEHSLEVQLPFIQYVMNGRDFTILPVSVSIHNKSSIERASQSLRKIYSKRGERDVVFILSSDFSHYVSSDQARQYDMPAIEKMMNMQADKLFEYVYNNNITICGISPILLFTYAFSDKVKGELLEYTDSSRAQAADKVVAYASIIYR